MNTHSLSWVLETLQQEGLARSTWLAKSEGLPWRGAVIDSRAECSGRLFFALGGERTDGHEFVRDAYHAGCVAAVIERPDMSAALKGDGVAHVVVTDVKLALQALARRYRSHLDATVIAITGSSGKTTTKEYVRAALRRRYRVHSNPGNFNSSIGVPLTIMEAEEDTEYLVSEIGSNRPGEIEFLSEMLRPDIGAITNIGDAHVGYFGSRDAIAEEKGSMLPHVGDGHAVLPRDDPYYQRLAALAGSRVVSFGANPPADFVVSSVETTPELSLRFQIDGQPFTLPTPGAYNAMNACAAVAVADVCGIGRPLAAGALAEVPTMPGRGRVLRAGGVWIVDESYNASPSSMVQSLDMLDGLHWARRIAVLGDMMELGGQTESQHRRVGEHIAATAVDLVFWLGDYAPAVRAGMERAGRAKELASPAGIEAVVEEVASTAQPGDVILVKGSRVCGLDRFVADVRSRLKQR